ncbi:P-loop containing nucleoside triphosphate hydrolase protein [Daedaleopsis nitida]|nr:P-loop containing nucleoside triphosphate hydrolase protein [Daedaleopsis nitida]
MSRATSVDYCPSTLYGGGCDDKSCKHQHDVRICELCVVICSPASNFDSHIQGRQHLGRLRDAGATARPVNGHSRRCIVCSLTLPESTWTSHLASEDHRKHQRLATLRAAYEQSEVNKHGVSVSHAETGVDFGVISLAQASEGTVVELTVSTQSPQTTSIVKTEVRSRISNHASLFAVTASSPSLKVVPGQPSRFTIRFLHVLHGKYEARLEFTFNGEGREPFVIARRLVVVVSDAQERELLKPVAPYVRGKRARWNEDGPTLAGKPPHGINTMKWARELLPFTIPPPLASLLDIRSPHEVLTRLREEYFPDALSQANYALFFQNLLYIEEHRERDDLSMYDMIGVEFDKQGRLFALHVHGLAEKRPSVAIGDTIVAQNSTGGATFKGVVHEIRQEQVHIDFHPSFDGNGRFNVRFQLNRTSLRRMHQALVASIPSPQRVLFPGPGFEGLDRPIAVSEAPVALFNSTIGQNAEQLAAIKAILHLRVGTAPYIVFGPPGTGKTVTIVEAIQQILHLNPTARILACAPSNSAADILALRLSTLSTDELFRCNAAFRDPSSVPAQLVPYTFRQGNNYALPPLDTLAKYRVIVTTCINAAFAYNIGLPAGHFSHIFVDEVGQASEPEVMVAIKPLALDHTRIVLSGDHKQLGPVVRSSNAREFGLERSYMDRLMELPLYSNVRSQGTARTKLTKNYRSHEAILCYPNEKFYDGELKVCGHPDTINAFLDSPQLPSPRFPLVFHAISGKNEREASSPSYFNVDEAIQVKAYIVDLLRDRRFPIQPRSIGVITPYHAQVRKIRGLLRKSNLAEVKVGSVEEFQGQERRVIIVSTVRSSADLLAYDSKFALGFLSNPRRFNVAMTRAQALLIVVGDATILNIDPLWRAFMDYAYLHKGWRGDEPTWDVNAPVLSDADYADEFRDAMAAEMNTVIERLPPEQDLEAEANVDREFWTNEDNTDW